MTLEGDEIPDDNKSDLSPDSARLPSFCSRMFIVDLVFCSLRVPFELLVFIGWERLKFRGSPLADSALYEVLTGLVLILFGISGNSLMLAKKKWAVWIGCFNLAAAIASIIVGFQYASIKMKQLELRGSKAAVIREHILTDLTVVVRYGIVICYVIALLKFYNWSKLRDD